MSNPSISSPKHDVKGVLIVTPTCCELSSSSKYNLYCRIQLGDEILQSTPATVTTHKHPYAYEWKQSFAVTLAPDVTNQEFLMLKVRDKGIITDSTQGRADIRIVDLLKLFNAGKQSVPIQLLHHENFNNHTGKLTISIEFKLATDDKHKPLVYEKAAQQSAPSAPSGPFQLIQTIPIPQSYSVHIQYQMEPFPEVKKGEELEPMLILDTTASMNYATSKDDKTPRKDTVREALSLIVEELARNDTQGKHEEGGGGLRTITFSGGHAVDLEDLNPSNLNQKWKDIKFVGGTYIIPAWMKMLDIFKEEFGHRQACSRPKLLALIVTDGEAEDTDEFAHLILQKNNVIPLASLYIVIAVLGYGAEHSRAVQRYRSIASSNAPSIRVIPFGAETDPSLISNVLLATLQ